MMNIIETRAVSNINKKDGKYVLEDKLEGLEKNLRFLIFGKNELFKYYLISGQILNNLHLNTKDHEPTYNLQDHDRLLTFLRLFSDLRMRLHFQLLFAHEKKFTKA